MIGKPDFHANRFLLWILLTTALLPSATLATNIEVPGDAATIQAGVDMAVNGDVVVLVDALYSGPGNQDVDFNGKAVTVRSQNETPASCVIDAAGRRGFFFQNGESASSRLIGVTVTNGFGAFDGFGAYGGAIYISGASPWIENCIFTGNSTQGSGGAIYIRDSDATISRCVFESNTADGGGGISCTRSATSLSPTISHCIFRNNVADFGGGLEIRNRSVLTVEYCTFTGNVANGAGGAVAMDFGIIQMDFCTLSGNSAGFAGAGIAGELPQGSAVSNTMIVNSVSGSAFYYWDEQGITFSCCNIFGNAGGDWTGGIEDQYPGVDNLSEDPQFCSSMPDDEEYWGIQADSPCSGDVSSCGQMGAWGSDCGTTATQIKDLGSLKALYR